jgi:putative MATE family efflux protein
VSAPVSDRTKRLAEGHIPRLLLTFSAPAIVGMMTVALYYGIDRIFVGRAVGDAGLAGMTVSFPFQLIMMALGMLVGIGSGSLVSLRLGQQRHADAEVVLGNATFLLVAGASMVTVAGTVWLDPILRLFGATDKCLLEARQYSQIIVFGAVFQSLGYGLNAIIRGEGSPRIAMLTMLVSVLLNLALAPLFLFVFHWGMRGAAIATVIAQAAAAIWVVAYFLSGRSHLRLRLENMQLRWAICTAIAAVGSPHCIMQLGAALLNSILNKQLGHYGGLQALAAWGILYSVMMLVFMPVIGLAQGAQPIIGYNYGAERFDRVKRTLQLAVLAATCFVLVGFTIALITPTPVIRLFVSRQQPDLEGLLALGSRAMRIAVLGLPLVGFQVISASYFQAIGKPLQSIFLMMSRQLLLLIPAVIILPRFLGLDGVWAALPTSDVLSAILTGVWLTLELRHLHRRHEATTAGGWPENLTASPEVDVA